MSQDETMTLYVTVQTQANNGGSPRRTYSLTHPDGTPIKDVESAADLAGVFLDYQDAGWTLIALLMVEETADKIVYEARLKRSTS